MGIPPRRIPKAFHSLTAKFLVCLVPVFLVVASAGFIILSQFEDRDQSDSLATRIGNQAARVATSLSHHHAEHNRSMATDLLSYLMVDRMVLCAEFRDTKSNRIISTAPPVIGCKNTTGGNRLVLSVGEDNTHDLVVQFSDAEIRTAAKQRRSRYMVLLSTAFVISLIIALVGFRMLVGRPLTRLHAAIQRISQTGERVSVDEIPDDELGEIINAFNEMIERESEREGILEQANQEIRILNHTLEDRVKERTAQALETEKMLRHVIENFGSGIYIHADFKPLYANETLLDMFGFEDLAAFTSLESTAVLLAPDERDRIRGYHEARLEGRAAPRRKTTISGRSARTAKNFW